MPVRIYDLAKKLGLETRAVLAKAKELGITTAKNPSSSLDKITAEFLEQNLSPGQPTEAPQPKLGANVGFIKLPMKRAIIKPTVRISQIARDIGLPTAELELIVRELDVSPGPAPDLLYKETADDLVEQIRKGAVAQTRLVKAEDGKTLRLNHFDFQDRWIQRISKLHHLQELDLSNTGLADLPDEFGNLVNLEVLDLSDNQIDRLPKWLLNLPKLRVLYLHGNQALNLPIEILGPKVGEPNAAKARDILEYCFRVQADKNKRPLNEGKLILLGRGEVGKTCLVNRLVHDAWSNTSMTCGIAITPWKIVLGNDTIRLHIWDFGGQEIQHATHQFFLTERSLYLVVLNGRAGGEDDDAEYWLKFVKTFGGGSPTIVVLNKYGTQPFEVDEAGLKEKYPFIREFIATDCSVDKKLGIDTLRLGIESALRTMAHIRAAFPREWFQIKDALAEMKEPFISFQQFRELCDRKNETDPEAQGKLAVFLNALGIALNFRDDPRLSDETILNPHWITKGVYRIITDPSLSESKGELRIDRLNQLLPADEYPPRMHGFLIELMKKFELCFPYLGDNLVNRYLVPELLGKKQPPLKDSFAPEACFNFRYDYRILPEGLLPRFITRTHVMSEKPERWRSGVVLRWEGCRALVKADRQERQVTIRVFGDPESRRRLLGVIRENFDQIHSEMKEFRPTGWIALEQNPNEWISLQDLEVFYQKNVGELQKAVGTEVLSINVAKTLKDADSPGLAILSLKERKQRPVKAFLSYAHDDERWRARIAPNLALLEHDGLLDLWCDLKINPGAKWDEEIKHKAEESELFILLVSTALLASSYVMNNELPIARRREQERKARVVPVIIKDCSWKHYLSENQVLPRNGKPIKTWSDQDAAFHNVEEGLRKAISDVHEMLRCHEVGLELNPVTQVCVPS